jgi:hypothetical protein
LALLPYVTPWQGMWLLAGSIFLAFKWIAWRRFCGRCNSPDWTSSLSFFCAWPGLDAGEFFIPRGRPATATAREWCWAAFKFAAGAVVIWELVRHLPGAPAWLAGAVGFSGYILLLHFGLFHLLALVWQAAGRNVRPVRDRPLHTTSLADFWGRRCSGQHLDCASDATPLPPPLLRGGGARFQGALVTFAMLF